MAAHRVILSAVTLLVCAVLAGCEPEVTPLPVVLPTSMPADLVSTALPDADTSIMRYSASADAAPFYMHDAPDLAISENPADFDLYVSFTPIPNGEIAPNPIMMGIVFSPAAPLMQNAVVAAAIRAAARADDSISQRVALANMGYPDGVTITMIAYTVPAWLSARLNAANIDAQAINADDPAALIANGRATALLIGAVSSSPIWDVWRAQVGADNVIALIDVPLYYSVRPDVTITFTENGFPLAQ